MIRGNKDEGALRKLFELGPVAGAEDGQLLARFADRRDEVAFGVLVARHGSMVWATARAVVRHEQDAEDVFQATFLTLARRAGSVRSGLTLGPWLHRVAYRAAVVASKASRRRRLREADAAGLKLATCRAGSPLIEPDLAATVRAEVERLPEVNRLPLILCDFEGLTYLEAADRLGWTEPALRNRLVQARSRLKDRLTRRGLAPTAGLLAIGPAVPTRLLRATTALALGHGAPSTTVLTILHVLLRGMLMTPIWKSINAGLLLVAALGVVGYATVPASPPRPAEPPPLAPPALAPASPLVDPNPDDPNNVRGRVIDPAGQPVAGAVVRTVVNFDHPDPASTVFTGPDGRFVLPTKTKFRHAEPMSATRGLMASAPGFGPGWTVDTLRPDVVIRLVPPGPDIEGRLVDEQHQPVAGAVIKATYLMIPVHQTSLTESGSLTEYFARPESDPLTAGTTSIPFERETKTDADGRFQIHDVGPERVILLVASAPTVVTTLVRASTRAEEAIGVTRHGMVESVKLSFQPARFEQALASTRPLTGVVTDAATGQALADWKVEGAVTTSRMHIEPDVNTRTDAEGRYRLTGFAVAPSYRIFFTPPAGQPYLPAGFRDVAAPVGGGSARFDLAASRVVIVRGRVTDRKTGAPLAGFLNAEALLTNPHIADYPGYAASWLVYRYTDAEGRFEVEVPPGPSIIGFRARDEGRYRSGQGAEQIAGYDPKQPWFATVGRETMPTSYHVLAQVDPPVGKDSLTLDLQIDGNQMIDLAVIDPEGRPLGALEVEGLTGFLGSIPQFQDSSTVTLSGFPPDGSREVIVRHSGRKLVGSMLVSAADGSPQTLQLGSWGEIKGRIVSDAGLPRPKIGLTGGPRYPLIPRPAPVGNLPWSNVNLGIKTDAQARFHIVGLVPGHHYGASAGDQNGGRIGDLFDDVTVAPGEVKDLGDIVVRPFPRRRQ